MQNIKFQLELTLSQKPGNFAHHKFQINFAN